MQTEINQLRIRSVVMVAIIVTVVLSIVFGSLFFITSFALEESSDQYLESLINRGGVGTSPLIQKRHDNNVQLPFLVVDISTIEGTDGAEEYAIIRNFGGFYDISNVESIETIVNLTMDTKHSCGFLPDYSMRYMMTQQEDGTYTIAFVDVSSQLATMDKLLRGSCFICACGIIAFTIIAIFMSKWMVRPIEKSWNQQKQFISDASHELKTPLTVITTNAELLQAPELDNEERSKYSSNIVTVSHQMRGLVEDLLNLSRLEKAENESYERINLSECINEALMQFEPVMFELGLPLEEHIDEDIFVKGNGQRLGQLVTILLDNAGKYSLPGTVKVQLSSQGRNAVLSVENPAESMSSEQLEKLFTRFYRADESRNAKGSYGLGLSIAQKICQTHRGKIKAEYKDGNIRFIATIPIA